MWPNSSSCLPSTNWRSSSVSLAHFCFSLPLVMFQSPLISSLFIIVYFLFSHLFAVNVTAKVFLYRLSLRQGLAPVPMGMSRPSMLGDRTGENRSCIECLLLLTAVCSPSLLGVRYAVGPSSAMGRNPTVHHGRCALGGRARGTLHDLPRGTRTIQH